MRHLKDAFLKSCFVRRKRSLHFAYTNCSKLCHEDSLKSLFLKKLTWTSTMPLIHSLKIHLRFFVSIYLFYYSCISIYYIIFHRAELVINQRFHLQGVFYKILLTHDILSAKAEKIFPFQYYYHRIFYFRGFIIPKKFFNNFSKFVKEIFWWIWEGRE